MSDVMRMPLRACKGLAEPLRRTVDLQLQMQQMRATVEETRRDANQTELKDELLQFECVARTT